MSFPTIMNTAPSFWTQPLTLGFLFQTPAQPAHSYLSPFCSLHFTGCSLTSWDQIFAFSIIHPGQHLLIGQLLWWFVTCQVGYTKLLSRILFPEYFCQSEQLVPEQVYRADVKQQLFRSSYVLLVICGSQLLTGRQLPRLSLEHSSAFLTFGHRMCEKGPRLFWKSYHQSPR